MGQEIKKFVDAQLKFDYELIQIVQRYECLYNTNHQLFSDIPYRKTQWESVGSQLNISSELCRVRWEDILKRFHQEVRWQTVFRGTSFWLLFHHLDFLHNSLSPLPSNNIYCMLD